MQLSPGELLSIAVLVIGLIAYIVRMEERVKRNRERHEELARTVRRLQEMLDARADTYRRWYDEHPH